MLPLSFVLAEQLGAALTEARKDQTIAGLRPDGSVQARAGRV